LDAAGADAGATELVLLRHGETDWNLERRIQGQLDIALNAEGRRQAHAAARRLAAQPQRYRLASARIVSSDLARCRQTAEAIALSTGLPVQTDARLRERHFGRFEGRTQAELRREFPDDYVRWAARDPDHDVAGGESLRHLDARVRAVFAELVRTHAGRTLIVVTHGGVLDIVQRMCRGLELSAPRDFDLPNAGLNRVRWAAGAFEVLEWADVSHWRDSLDDVDSANPVKSDPIP